ncbi:glycine betaine ABC transporter substrate-binding protein [Microbacterium sp. A196]|uniref:glycine betaine ABC transporter substrate-binding protein n=1 Tax=Microbacterium sp. A196 TaxID=3457320 RepID=UPI003FD35812
MQMNSVRFRVMTAASLVGAALALSACSGAGSGSDGSEDTSVTIATVAGYDGTGANYVWKQLLEDQGYAVDIIELDLAQSFLAVANGDADLFFLGWLPKTHSSYFEEHRDDYEILGEWNDPAILTLAVPTYLEDVNSIEDLKGRADEFDGTIVGIEAGTGVNRIVMEDVIPDYALDGYTLSESSTAAMLATVEDATSKKEPIVFTAWTPHWMFARYPVKALEDPEGSFGDPDSYTVLSSKTFASGHDEVSAWMNEFYLDPDQFAELDLAITEVESDAEKEKVAATWIEEHQDLVDSWVK